MSIRTTDLGIASHRRLVYRNVIAALRTAFDSLYDRDRQLVNLRITQQYPLQKIDYPSIVVEYQNRVVENAGVGHVEWFSDPLGRWRKWYHNRFEGTLNLRVYALSTLDRDIIADAIVELIRFGRLNQNLNRFFEIIYPEADNWGPQPDGSWLDYDYNMFSQLMLDSDRLVSSGDSVMIAPWQPEDVLVYTTGYSVALHGGYYNTNPAENWSRVTRIRIEAYATDQFGVDLPFPGNFEVAWDPPFQFNDASVVAGKSIISGVETFGP